MNAVLLVSLLFAQVQDKHIGRTEKEPYLAGVRELAKAVDLISDDPQAAVEKVSTILSSSKIKHFEVRLLIEVAPQIKEPYEFFPYQVRGRARVELAKKQLPETAVTTLTAAIEDFKVSVKARVPGSADLQKAAEEALDKAKAAVPKDDPIDEFRRLKFAPLIRDNKFKSAVALVNGDDGKVLKGDQRQGLVQEAEEGCRSFVADRLYKIRGYLNDIGSVRALKELGESGFRQQFQNQVPPAAELTEKEGQDPELVWIRNHVKTLKAIQVGQAKPEDVFAAAQESLAADGPYAEVENPWFKAMALLGGNMVEDVISKSASEAENKAKVDRARFQGDADRAGAAWKEFVEKVDKKVQERHSQLGEKSDRIDRLSRSFPVELTNLASYDIDRCFTSDDPGKEFKNLEEKLLDLVSSLSGMGRVAIESRQELYTKYIIAGAIRRMFDGTNESEIARDFQNYRDGLKKAGGPTAIVEKYGPKVKKVFEGLKT